MGEVIDQNALSSGSRHDQADLATGRIRHIHRLMDPLAAGCREQWGSGIDPLAVRVQLDRGRSPRIIRIANQDIVGCLLAGADGVSGKIHVRGARRGHIQIEAALITGVRGGLGCG